MLLLIYFVLVFTYLLFTYLLFANAQPTGTTDLSVADLLKLALNVADGCRYLENNHFIHRYVLTSRSLVISAELIRH